jgi:formamidopyrimidine-DNA glycosylase
MRAFLLSFGKFKMPELPEVQCVVTSMQRLVGKRIGSVQTHTHQLRERVDPELEQKLAGRTITGISRRAKYILIALDEGYIVAHLGMTGKFTIDLPPEKHDHIIFEFSDGTVLRYNDPRKFGFVIHALDPYQTVYLRSIGIEPLSRDFDAEWMYAAIQRSKQTAKQFLLDQKFIAGLGNIYVNEVLYVTRIHPQEPIKSLSHDQVEWLVREIKLMLEDSIRKGGSSISDYRDADNQQGNFQKTFNVYQRDQDKLGNAVVSIKQNSRSTFYCPSLQILKDPSA